ncbi:MAG: hydroxymethylbilane synthase [Candidatus Andeanibacterium colombiense]|uniref:Porphobilinogen deaminase n=1 Tax=Candidatus Andeanibacterium colombiense TaxID=3121345 RepID=A0AAJ6BQ02_9SPHN|nr:MAG: hydroxymethylbilane synthase [Sphingomonadaceae bacterium]
MSIAPILRLGTRRSPLAMAQAEETRARLCAAHGWNEEQVELVPVLASGDKVLDRPLADIGGKALWTKELDAWLAEGLIDAAVHSLKDVETLRPASLTIAAVLPRADVRDVLVGAASLGDLPAGARIGTSAPRRAAQVLHLRPDCSVVSFRGNVQTRLQKLAAGEADATLLAAAGLERLGMVDVGTPLGTAAWLPAPSQGAIGIECNADDDATRALLAAIDHAPSRAQVMAERALLVGLEGNCHSPIGVLCDGSGELSLRASIFSPDGAERVDGEIRFAAGDMQEPLALAADLLARAGPAIRQHFGG